MERYDLIVIGSGPAGRRGAIQAAKLGKSVLVIENRLRVGGVSVHTGTIPVEDLARDGAQPFGLAGARVLWARLPGEEGHRGQGPRGAAAEDARPRDRGAGAPVRAERGEDLCGRGAVHRSPYAGGGGRGERGAHLRGREDHPRRGDDAAPAQGCAVQRPQRVRQRQYRDRAACAAQPDGGGRRGHRHRVCDDLFGPRRAGDDHRAARQFPRVHRPRDRRRVRA